MERHAPVARGGGGHRGGGRVARRVAEAAQLAREDVEEEEVGIRPDVEPHDSAHVGREGRHAAGDEVVVRVDAQGADPLIAVVAEEVGALPLLGIRRARIERPTRDGAASVVGA